MDPCCLFEVDCHESFTQYPSNVNVLSRCATNILLDKNLIICSYVGLFFICLFFIFCLMLDSAIFFNKLALHQSVERSRKFLSKVMRLHTKLYESSKYLKVAICNLAHQLPEAQRCKWILPRRLLIIAL